MDARSCELGEGGHSAVFLLARGGLFLGRGFQRLFLGLFLGVLGFSHDEI